MLKIKTREKCSLPIKKMIKSFINQGHDIAIINNSDRETLIAHNKQCISYFYFTEDEDGEPKEVLPSDKERIKKVRWINNFVNKCIGDYIKDNKPELKYFPYDLYFDKVEPYEYVDTPKLLSAVAYFDIRHAYLQVAYKLGYINRSAYFKLLRIYPDYKLEICAAIQTLSKRIQCTYFKKGSSSNISHIIECNYMGIKEIRNNIIDASHLIMYKLCNDNQIDIYLRNVDSVVIKRRDARKLAKLLNGMSIKYKCVQGLYVGNGLIREKNGNLFEAGDSLV